MERLTFEVNDGGIFVKESDVKTFTVEDEIMHTGNAVRKLAEYEDLEEQGKLSYKWISEEKPPEVPCYVLLSFDNFSMPLIGRYEEDEEGGAFYIGDDEESCISQDLIVNGWMPLPEPYREGAGEELRKSHPTEKEEVATLGAEMVADIDHAIEYFKDKLLQIKIFSDIVSFQERERKSIETALKVLHKVQKESREGQQDNQCATSHG